MRLLSELIATFFYVGKIPWAPGTAGSLAGLLLYSCFLNHPIGYAIGFVMIVSSGIYASGRIEKALGKKDPQEIVIDEVAGIYLVYFLIPFQWFYLIAGFLLYRFFDIVKPFPVRQIERLRGGWGIMGDDLLCAVGVNLILQFLWRICRISLS